MKNKKVISQEEYFTWLHCLSTYILLDTNTQAIVCLKRSGFIMGAYLSHSQGLPLFVLSEAASIPKHFTSLLLVDDKICTGKSLRQASNRLLALEPTRTIKTAVLFVEGTVKPDYWVCNLGSSHKMFYEVV